MNIVRALTLVRQRCLQLSSFSFRGRENLVEGDGMGETLSSAEAIGISAVGLRYIASAEERVGERKRNPLASLAHYSAATQATTSYRILSFPTFLPRNR
jgi:hypothetical protein